MAEYGSKEYVCEQLDNYIFDRKVAVKALQHELMSTPFPDDDLVNKLCKKITSINWNIEYNKGKLDEILAKEERPEHIEIEKGKSEEEWL